MTSKKIVLTDGGMGQELVHRGAANSSPMWGAQVMIDQPQLVVDLHKDYIAAGSKVITLNAYSLTPERLANVGAEDQFEALHAMAVELATQARDEAGVEGVRIAGTIPPLYSSYQPELCPAAEQALATYRKIVNVQASYVDMFICETMSSVKEAVASTTAASESGLPVWTALSVDDSGSGHLRSGESIADTWQAIHTLGAEAILLNCSIPEAVDAAWPHMQKLPCSVGAYANGFTSVLNLKAGGSVDVLEARTDLGPHAYSSYAMKWVELGASIIGGCCEISPAHIDELAQQLIAQGYEIGF